VSNKKAKEAKYDGKEKIAYPKSLVYNLKAEMTAFHDNWICCENGQKCLCRVYYG
jgi:hypothetical protein